jgi:hypothetical protein
MVRVLCLSIGMLALLQRFVWGGTINYFDTEFPLPVGSVGTFTVPQYADPGGMPLTKVTLKVSALSFGGSNTFDNEDPIGGTATVTIGTDVKVNGPLIGSALVVHAVPLYVNSGSVTGDNDGVPDFIGTDSIKVIGGTTASDVNSTSRTAAFDITPYQGAGLVTFDFSMLTSTAGSFSTTAGGANSVEFGSISASFTATVTYEFVPEPTSFALLFTGGSLIALVAYCRRRRSG